MARSKSKVRSQARRDTFDIANDPESLLRWDAFADPDRSLLEVEDRRQFYPGVYRPARTFGGWARLGLVAPAKRPGRAARKVTLASPVGFAVPRSTLICVRRKQRRQVLHALKKAGRGGMRRPRRNAFSSIRCRSR